MSDLSNQLVIDDSNWRDFTEEAQPDKGFGLIPRDYRQHPVGSIRGVGLFDPRRIKLIPRNEWSSRIRDMEQSRTRLSDLRRTGNQGGLIPSLDQNGQGYCWAYSPASAITLIRARDNQPYHRLSAHAVACVIKNFRDQGGWNPQAVEYAIKHGYPTVDTWPEKSMSRSHNTQRTWQEARKFRVSEGWMELQASIYDRSLTLDQLISCLIQRIPCPVDHMWWRHSVCAEDPVEVDSSLSLMDERRWGTRILNSWTDGWGDAGEAVLAGTKATPDGATALSVATISH